MQIELKEIRVRKWVHVCVIELWLFNSLPVPEMSAIDPNLAADPTDYPPIWKNASLLVQRQADTNTQDRRK